MTSLSYETSVIISFQKGKDERFQLNLYKDRGGISHHVLTMCVYACMWDTSAQELDLGQRMEKVDFGVYRST